jgi:hypothetical protein
VAPILAETDSFESLPWKTRSFGLLAETETSAGHPTQIPSLSAIIGLAVTMSPTTTVEKTIYIGPFVHCKTLQELDICTTGAIGVNESGVIEFIERNVKSLDDLAPRDGWKDAKRVMIRDNGFFFPGFIGRLIISAPWDGPIRWSAQHRRHGVRPLA